MNFVIKVQNILPKAYLETNILLLELIFRFFFSDFFKVFLLTLSKIV